MGLETRMMRLSTTLHAINFSFIFLLFRFLMNRGWRRFLLNLHRTIKVQCNSDRIARQQEWTRKGYTLLSKFSLDAIHEFFQIKQVLLRFDGSRKNRVVKLTLKWRLEWPQLNVDSIFEDIGSSLFHLFTTICLIFILKRIIVIGKYPKRLSIWQLFTGRSAIPDTSVKAKEKS